MPHSPGPWAWGRVGTAIRLYDKTGRFVLMTNRGSSIGVSNDDGRLIAAAPELLALVRKYLADSVDDCAFCQEARALIARIEGDK